jgi:hypothetical protein
VTAEGLEKFFAAGGLSSRLHLLVISARPWRPTSFLLIVTVLMGTSAMLITKFSMEHRAATITSLLRRAMGFTLRLRWMLSAL